MKPTPLSRKLLRPAAASARIEDACGKPIPVFLITGFLGSGKTTLLRKMLDHPGMGDTALIINEFGAVGLDQMLVQSSIENVLLMEDGCLCCSVRGDLIDTIGNLFANVRNGDLPAFSRIIIETTGLADPTTIVQDLTAARGVANRVEIAKVIVTVDGIFGAAQIEEVDEIIAQVAQADICVVTKCDVVELDAVTVLIQQLRDLNPAAEIVRNDETTVEYLLEPNGDARTSAAPGRFRCEDVDAKGRVHGRVQSWSIRHEAPLSWSKFRAFLDLLYSTRPANMLRMKGILHIEGQARPIVVHGVGAMVNEATSLEDWPHERPVSEIVVIVTDLPGEAVGQLFDAVVLDGAGVQ